MGIRKKTKSIWICWENQRRNREISSALHIKLYEYGEIDSIENPIKKYFKGIIKTKKAIITEKPNIIICQNPSLVLSLFLICIKKIHDLRVVVDSHNAGLFPLNGHFKILNFASSIIQRYADLTIVTNRYLKKHVEGNGGRAFVLPDKIPSLKNKNVKDLKGKYNLLFICTYSDDEPYEKVIGAAKLINKNIVIYVSGNFKKKSINIGEVPENVILTGFLPENDYIAILNSVDATIDLTNRENCLVCGAYESIAVGKPMVLSKTNVLMEYFNQGAVYVDHTTDSISRGINEVIRRQEELSAQIKKLKKSKISDWQKKKNELIENLNQIF